MYKKLPSEIFLKKKFGFGFRTVSFLVFILFLFKLREILGKKITPNKIAHRVKTHISRKRIMVSEQKFRMVFLIENGIYIFGFRPLKEGFG